MLAHVWLVVAAVVAVVVVWRWWRWLAVVGGGWRWLAVVDGVFERVALAEPTEVWCQSAVGVSAVGPPTERERGGGRGRAHFGAVGQE